MKSKTALIAFVLFAATAFAQVEFGVPAFGSIDSYGPDAINRQNLNAHLTVPIVSLPGRGSVSINTSLNYDGLVWAKNGSVWSPAVLGSLGQPTWGWQRLGGTGTVTIKKHTVWCIDQETGWRIHTQYVDGYTFIDYKGNPHDFNVTYDQCYDNLSATSAYSTDNTGYLLTFDQNSAWSPQITGPDGFHGLGVALSGTTYDNNGNFVTYSPNSNVTSVLDTRGNTALIVDESVAGETSYKVIDQNGGNSTVYKVIYSTKNIHTYFNCAGVTEYTTTGVLLPTQLQTPVGNYTFTYELNSDPNSTYSGYVTARISQVTLPTGGTIQYQYPGSHDGMNCSDGSVSQINRIVNDGTTNSQWSFSRAADGSNWKTTESFPQMPYDTAENQTVYTFSGTQEIERDIYQGSSTSGGTLLAKVLTAWSNGYPVETDTKLPLGGNSYLQSMVSKTFSFGGPTSVTEYDWGVDAFGAARRTTTTGYSADAVNNVWTLVQQTRVYDGSYTLTAATDYLYDQNTISTCPTGMPGHDDYYYGANSSKTRWNLTSVKQYASVAGGTPSDPFTTSMTHDCFGNVLTTSVNGTLQSTSNYSATTKYNSPDSVIVGPNGGPNLTTSYAYNAYTGLPASVTDSNGGQTSLQYDAVFRTTSITRPDQKSVTYSYDDQNHTVTVTSPLDGASTLSSTAYADGFGRTIKTASPTAKAEVQYDPFGRAYKASNPYALNGSAANWTTTKFDALGRLTQTVLPDQQTSSNSYGFNTTDTIKRNTVTVTDPAGKQRKQEFDALGRMLRVLEPDPANGNTLTLATDYTYSALNSLLTVSQVQSGTPQITQTRTFVYDPLNRATSITTPEAGTVTYAYKSGGTWCSASPSSACSRTDARGVVTSYSFDALSRPYQVSYNVTNATPSGSVPSTPTVTYSYGTSSANHNNGRLITMTDGTGNEAYTYDLMGRTLTLGKTVTGSPQTFTTQYAYNDAGQVKTITYPSGMVINQNVDVNGALSSITEGTGTPPTKTYLSSLSYNSAGQVTGYQMGASTPITSTIGYTNDRLQLSSLAYLQSGNNILSLTYGYSQNNGNNGQITSINDALKNGRNATYSYDALSRLTGFSTASSFTENGSNYGAESMSWTYDRFGNRLAQTRSGNPTTISVDASTNRMNATGYTYDLSGNLTNDGTYGMTWDAEGRMATYSASISYAYDGNSIRLKKTDSNGTTVYIRAGAQTIAEYPLNALPTVPAREFIYAGGQLLASKASGNYKWYVSDHLSTRAVWDDAAQALLGYGHLPFGETWYPNSSDEKWRFTNYERENDSTQDFAVFRQYLYTKGRFLSADPVLGDGDPQSWNRYTYTLNDPTNLVDPLGQDEFSFGGPCHLGDTLMPSCDWDLGGGGGWWTGDVDEFGGGGWGMFPGENSVNFPVPPLWVSIWEDAFGLPHIPTMADIGCNPICDASPANNGNSTRICGDFVCDSNGKPVGVAPPEIRGIQPTNIEFDTLLGGFYLSRINSNPILRIGPGYVKGGTRIIRAVSGGPGLPWWWHIWNGPKWPF